MLLVEMIAWNNSRVGGTQLFGPVGVALERETRSPTIRRENSEDAINDFIDDVPLTKGHPFGDVWEGEAVMA